MMPLEEIRCTKGNSKRKGVMQLMDVKLIANFQTLLERRKGLLRDESDVNVLSGPQG